MTLCPPDLDDTGEEEGDQDYRAVRGIDPERHGERF